MIIRDLNLCDIWQVLEIAKDSFSIPWSKESFIKEYKNPQSIFKVVEFNDEIIGYIIAKKILDEAEILSIAVKQSFRRKGIAEALLKEILSTLKKEAVKVCYLEVRISNFSAINLYKKVGFKECGIRKNYYISPLEDALLMKIVLNN